VKHQSPRPTPEPGSPGIRHPHLMTTGPRYTQDPAGLVCEDCGVLVLRRATHTRFHSIMSSWAWTLAVLKTSHLAAHVHDRYDVTERIDRRRFDNWSADALAEVTGQQPPGPPPDHQPG